MRLKYYMLTFRQMKLKKSFVFFIYVFLVVILFLFIINMVIVPTLEPLINTNVKVLALNAINETIKNTAKVLGLSDKIHEGMLTTMDVYGPYIDYDRVLNRIPTDYEILGEEMEAFALIHVANSLNVAATAMATVADSKFSNTVMSIEDRQNRLNDMIKLALIAIIK